MNWRIKGAIQKALGYVPMGDRIHHALQRRAGLAGFIRECDLKVEDWRIAMGYFRSTNIALAGATLVEIGAGWYPTLPACMWLAGAARIISYDLRRHQKPDLVLQLAERLRAHVPMIARESGLAEDAVERKRASFQTALSRGADLAAATDGVLDYRAPADFVASGLADGSIDLGFSNSVLEHVVPEVLPPMFREIARILKPGAPTYHSVNCGDHYAYFDRSISQLHYLQFTEAQWQRWNNDFQYQNRWRAKEFLRLARDAGLVIELDASVVRPERLAELATVEVAPEFAGYTREELSHTNIDFIARKPA